MKTRGVHSHREGFLLELLDDVRGQFILLAVIPHSDSPVTRASGYDLFLEAHVHAEDRVRVEGADEVGVMLVIRGPFKVNWNLKNLVRAHCEDEGVFSG